VFLGARPYKDNFYNTGRETFMLPVRWVDGWPRILDGNATVPYSAPRPNLPPQPNARALKSGNFTERDDFTETNLPLYWTFMRTVREPWFDLTSRPGWLTINARPADIGKRTQPSFIGRRQQHAFATVTTALQFTPLANGDKAGLAAFQSDDNYYLLVITRSAGKAVIQLEQSIGRGLTRVLASAPLTSAPGATVYENRDAGMSTTSLTVLQRTDSWF
jgi:alpha-N-arabinofuranosidase